MLKDWQSNISHSTKRNALYKTKRLWKKLTNKKKWEAQSRWNLHLREIAHSNTRKFWKTSKNATLNRKIQKQ